MADKQRLLLSLALGQDTAKRVEKLPTSNAKEQRIAQSEKVVNRPGRS